MTSVFEYLMRCLPSSYYLVTFAQNWKTLRSITTPCRIVSISTTCWTKFVLHGYLSDFTINRYMLSQLVYVESVSICRESQFSSEESSFGLYHPNNPLRYLFQEFTLGNPKRFTFREVKKS